MPDELLNGQEAQGQQEPQQVPQVPPVEPQQAQQEDDSFFGPSFLEGLSEVERKLLEPRVNDWEQKVRERFEQTEAQYKEQLSPYQQLNLDPNNLHEAAILYQHVSENPAAVFYAIGQSIGYSPQQLQALAQGYTPQQVGAPQQPPQQTQPQQTQQNDPYAEFDPQLREFIVQQQQKTELFERNLNNVMQFIVAQNQKQQQEMADAELQMTLYNLQQQYGDFDQEYVLTQLYNGRTPEQAMQSYQQMLDNIQQQAMQRAQQAPPVLSGNGSVPQEEFNAHNASNKEVRDMVASLMRASAQS